MVTSLSCDSLVPRGIWPWDDHRQHTLGPGEMLLSDYMRRVLAESQEISAKHRWRVFASEDTPWFMPFCQRKACDLKCQVPKRVSLMCLVTSEKHQSYVAY